jgi:hypothetical protein
MRVETPRAEAHFVKTRSAEENNSKFDTTTVAGVVELWETVERLSNVPVEFKTGNWVLESSNEITEEHLEQRWALNVKYKNFSSYTNIECLDNVLDFYGSANAEAHQLLASLSDEITNEGYKKFASYETARVEARRNKYTKRKVGKLGKKTALIGQFSSLSNQGSKVNMDALYKAFIYAGRLYRNMLVIAVSIAAFTSLDHLKTMIFGIIPPTVALGILVFTWERELLKRDKIWNERRKRGS